MKRVNSGSMKFRNYSANCCMLVKFVKLSEGKIRLSIDLNPIFHSFNKHHLSPYHVPGPPTGCQVHKAGTDLLLVEFMIQRGPRWVGLPQVWGAIA